MHPHKLIFCCKQWLIAGSSCLCEDIVIEGVSCEARASKHDCFQVVKRQVTQKRRINGTVEPFHPLNGGTGKSNTLAFLLGRESFELLTFS